LAVVVTVPASAVPGPEPARDGNRIPQQDCHVLPKAVRVAGERRHQGARYSVQTHEFGPSRRKDSLSSLTPDSFYRSMVFAAALTPHARREQMLEVHEQVLEGYLAGLNAIPTERAEVYVPRDGRTLAQVVGHILEWDRAILIAFGEILAGVRWPRIMTRSLNIDPDGEPHEFESEDSFNSFYARKQLDEPWTSIRARAIEAARALHSAFTAPGLLTAERLEATKLYSGFGLPTGETLDMPCGWYLWMTALEHEGVDHLDALMSGSIA
jgi:hypothetical protein